MNKAFKQTIKELKEHSPFTAIATLIAILIVIYFQFITKQNISENLFEILHPIHILASAIVTSAIYYKYKTKILPAILIGITGSLLIGSVSDIIFPYFGGTLMNLNTTFHLPLIEKPILIISLALIGSITGILIKTTKIPHLVHVFLSVFASLFYLMAFSQTFNLIYFIGAFAIVFISVIIPCCLSDIVFPFLFIGKDKNSKK